MQNTAEKLSPNSPEESRGLLTMGHERDTAVNHRSRQVGGVVTKEKQGGRLLLKTGDQAGARGREGKWEEPASLRGELAGAHWPLQNCLSCASNS